MLKTGKLDSEILKEIVLDSIELKREEVLVRPSIGEDCAVIDFGQYECILSTDPITAAISEIGRLSIHVSCNDIAASGISPLGIMLAVMLPIGSTKEDVKTIMQQASKTAKEVGIEIIGGHTEITPAVNTPVIVSTAIGRGIKGRSQSGKKMKPGDFIVMTKYAGIEGTGIIAADYKERLSKILSSDEINEAENLFKMLSVIKEGSIGGKIGTNGMHDITEGGILGAVWEMCQISELGAQIWVEEIPVLDVTKKICSYFGIDYLRLISSGAMLIIVSEEKVEKLINELESANIKATAIGRILPSENGIYMVNEGKNIEIKPPGSDELYKVIDFNR